MNIDEILEEMDELLDKSASVPFVSHKKVVDGERLRELINDIRLNLPPEMKAAQQIEFDCQRILNEAKITADSTIRRAEERASQIVSKEAVVTEAKKKAVEILKNAQKSSAEIQKSAALSVAQMLNDAEASHQKSLLNIKVTKEKLQHILRNSPAFGDNAQNAVKDFVNDNQ